VPAPGPPWQPIVHQIAARAEIAGLDLVSPLRVAWYNDAVEPAYRLSDLGRPGALAVLIGNTRVLWGRFVEALRRDGGLLEAEHPLETYVTRATVAALTALRQRWLVRWAHDTVPAPVAMQRLAHTAGLAYLAPSHLSVHPTFGPWIALRGVAVVDVDGPAERPPEPAKPCGDCEVHCMAAYRRALVASGIALHDHGALATSWAAWLAVRDACPAGRAYRYDDDQARYHYTKERSILERAAAQR